MEIIGCFMFHGKCMFVTSIGDIWEVSVDFDRQPIMRKVGHMDLIRP